MGNRPMNPDVPHYHGHRQRLRQRFLKSGFAGMAEHEVVELILTLAIPRKDVKKPAKELLAQVGHAFQVQFRKKEVSAKKGPSTGQVPDKYRT
jgi:DNA repair protein RadC